MVTLKQIAQKCGCSAATVSKALNGMKDISPEKREEITKVANEMGYRFNAAAKTLKTSKSYTIGLLMFLNKGSAWKNEYYGGIANDIQDALGEKNYDLIPIDCHLKMSVDDFVYRCYSHNYDGMIVMNYGYTHEHLQKLVEAEIPVVTIDDPWDGVSGVSSDNINGIKDLVRYAYNLGHRKIAFIYGNEGLATTLRRQGFKEITQELNINIPENYVEYCLYNDAAQCQGIVSRMLDMEDPPTCILCPDDFAMIGAFNELRLRKMECPRDISLAGYDGIQLSTVIKPEFTTVYQDTREIGRQVVELLFEEMQKKQEGTHQHITVPCQLIKGETIGRVET